MVDCGARRSIYPKELNYLLCLMQSLDQNTSKRNHFNQTCTAFPWNMILCLRTFSCVYLLASMYNQVIDSKMLSVGRYWNKRSKFSASEPEGNQTELQIVHCS